MFSYAIKIVTYFLVEINCENELLWLSWRQTSRGFCNEENEDGKKNLYCDNEYFNVCAGYGMKDDNTSLPLSSLELSQYQEKDHLVEEAAQLFNADVIFREKIYLYNNNFFSSNEEIVFKGLKKRMINSLREEDLMNVVELLENISEQKIKNTNLNDSSQKDKYTCAHYALEWANSFRLFIVDQFLAKNLDDNKIKLQHYAIAKNYEKSFIFRWLKCKIYSYDFLNRGIEYYTLAEKFDDSNRCIGMYLKTLK